MGVESFWALLKRGYYGTFHHFSVKHFNRYVSEFSTRHNTLFMGSDERFRYMIRISIGKRITYSKLIT
ncbi:transposase [Candidatus Liberibacter solanacearum]|uniref:transposase n=1 Tax=Candidatus Liberibacter solanacearum TaxID=556287 RepID=UPI0009D734EA